VDFLPLQPMNENLEADMRVWGKVVALGVLDLSNLGTGVSNCEFLPKERYDRL
jgi:hypothetical protein